MQSNDARIDDNQLHMVDAKSPDSLSLLAQAYREIYEPLFDPEDREDLQDWVETLSGKNDFAGMAITICGQNLDGAGPVIKGLTMGYHYKDQDVNLIAYALVDDMLPTPEKSTLQHAMLDATADSLRTLAQGLGSKMGSAFIELDDPSKMTTPDDAAFAEQRLKMFQEFGAKIVNIGYISPPLSKEGEKNESLLLLAYPDKTGDYPTKNQLEKFITGIYAGLEENTGIPSSKNPDYVRIIAQINDEHPIYTNLRPISKSHRPTTNIKL